MPLTREQMARRAALELRNGSYVNLGVGIPMMVANYIPSGVEVMLHSGHGVFGLGPDPDVEHIDPDLISVETSPTTIVPGAAFCATVDSFCAIRGGKLELAIMGGMEV